MRELKQSAKFKKDRKHVERSGQYGRVMKERFKPAVLALLNDEPLDISYWDHPLKGDMQGSRECHLSFDFLLVYRYEGDDILWLERLGSHSEIFDM